ncbi:MAG: biosynthetic peptidoglycan transglycosylase [Polyangiales bacterium]
MARASRRWLIPLVIVAVALVAAGAAWPLVRAKTRASVEERCRAALGGQCTLGAMELTGDGVTVRDIRAMAVGNTVRATVQRVDARFSWWDALTGRRGTPLSVAIDGVEMGEDAPLADFVREVRAWRDARASREGAAEARESRFKLVRLDLDHLQMTAQIAPFSRAMLSGGAAHWTETGPARVSWADASVTLGPITAFQSGRCELEVPEDGSEGVVQCERFRTRIDAGDAVERARSVQGILQLLQSIALRPSANNASPTTTTVRTDTSGPLALSASTQVGALRERIAGGGRLRVPRSWRLRAREGVVEIRRGENAIATFSNASAEIEVNDGSLRIATARLGSDQRGPALDLRVERPANEGWSLTVRGAELPLAEVARWVRGVPWHDVERGTVRVDGRVRPMEGGRFSASGSCELRDFGLAHSKLAHDPVVGLTVALDGAAEIDLNSRRISTDGMNIAVNDVRARVRGWAERSSDHTAIDVTASMERTSCDGIRRSLPASLTGPVSEFSFGGDIAANVALALDTRRIDDTRLDVRVDDRCYVARDTYTRGVARFSGPFVQRVQEPGRMRAFVTGPGTAAWVPLGDIAPHMINAVLSREDGRFYRHAGVDPQEIRNAIVRNVSAGRFVYGASTLSMQLAKNVFLAREKTLVRKLQEFVLTWYLERTLGKDAILELYLNVVEFGPGVYGVGPASRFYFGVEPSQLSPSQAIFIATLLPNPVQRSAPFFRGAAGNGTLAMVRGHARIMHHRGLLTDEELAATQVDPLAFRPRRGPVNGVLTIEVDNALDDQAAIARAMTVAVPAHAAPAGEPESNEPEREVVQAQTNDDGERDRDDERAREPSEEPEVTRVGYRRPTVRIH